MIKVVRCLPRFLTGELANNPLTACLSMLRMIIIHVFVKIFVMARFIH